MEPGVCNVEFKTLHKRKSTKILGLIPTCNRLHLSLVAIKSSPPVSEASRKQASQVSEVNTVIRGPISQVKIPHLNMSAQLGWWERLIREQNAALRIRLVDLVNDWPPLFLFKIWFNKITIYKL